MTIITNNLLVTLISRIYEKIYQINTFNDSTSDIISINIW